MTKLPHLILGLTVVITVLLLFSILREEPEAGHGIVHPDFPNNQMKQGVDPGRHANLIVIGGLYGGLQILLTVAGLCLAIRRERSSLIPLLLATTAYLAVFVALLVTYSNGMQEAPIVLGFPLPTALMVFGMWGVPFVFVVLYIVKFRDWIYNEDDAAKFSQLLIQSTQNEATGSVPRG